MPASSLGGSWWVSLTVRASKKFGKILVFLFKFFLWNSNSSVFMLMKFERWCPLRHYCTSLPVTVLKNYFNVIFNVYLFPYFFSSNVYTNVFVIWTNFKYFHFRFPKTNKQQTCISIKPVFQNNMLYSIFSKTVSGFIKWNVKQTKKLNYIDSLNVAQSQSVLLLLWTHCFSALLLPKR